MLSTTDRYLLKEVLLTFFAVLLVLLAMVLCYRLVGYLSQAASGTLARDAILLLIGLQAIRYLVVLMPLASLLAIMLALGRLYQDSEMTALAACGLGPLSIYKPLFLIIIPTSMTLAILTLFVQPLCMEIQNELKIRARQDAELSIIKPGVFREVLGGQHVIYVDKLTEGGKELKKIFIHSRLRNGIAITTSERGYQEIDPDTGARYMVLNDGYRYEGSSGQGDYRRLEFQRLSVRVNSAPAGDTRLRREAVPTKELLPSGIPSYLAEFHKRLSGPICLLVIVFLAPLLARTQPGEGRYGRVVAAILIYTIYFNLLGVGQAWLEHEILWSDLGLWWVHGIMLLLGLGLLLYQYGFKIPATGRSITENGP